MFRRREEPGLRGPRKIWKGRSLYYFKGNGTPGKVKASSIPGCNCRTGARTLRFDQTDFVAFTWTDKVRRHIRNINRPWLVFRLRRLTC